MRPPLSPRPARLSLPVYDERGGAFAKLRNRRVLIYWPHGLGDFVHLSLIIPFLDPSNTYFITRFGDDFAHLYDGCERVMPLYSGVRRISDGSDVDARHLGINFKRIRNREATVRLPEPLHSRVRSAEIDAILYTDYPDPAGSQIFPYHTKARALARDLIEPSQLAAVDFAKPLRSALPLKAPPEIVAAVEARLRAVVAPGENLYLLAPGGHTNARKVWPDEQVVRLAETLRTRDRRSRVLQIDERTAAQLGHDPQLLPTTADLFGDANSHSTDSPNIPFAHLLTVIVRASHTVVGVPAGPLHLALAIGERPIIGIWLTHHPDWYDEPCPSALHLLGPYTFHKKFERRAAARTLPATWRHRTQAFRDRIPTADDVLIACDEIT